MGRGEFYLFFPTLTSKVVVVKMIFVVIILSTDRQYSYHLVVISLSLSLLSLSLSLSLGLMSTIIITGYGLLSLTHRLTRSKTK